MDLPRIDPGPTRWEGDEYTTELWHGTIGTRNNLDAYKNEERTLHIKPDALYEYAGKYKLFSCRFGKKFFNGMKILWW